MANHEKSVKCGAVKVRRSLLMAALLKRCVAVLAGEDVGGLEVWATAEMFERGRGRIVVEYEGVEKPAFAETPECSDPREVTDEERERNRLALQRARSGNPKPWRRDLHMLADGWIPNKAP